MATLKIHKQIKKLAAYTLLSMVSTCAFAESLPMSTNADGATSLMDTAKRYGLQAGGLKELARSMGEGKPVDGIYLPAGGLYVIEGKDGSLTTITGTGRYAVSGSLYDIVKKANITNVDQLRRTTLIKLTETPFPLDEISSIAFGNPSLKRQGALFITIDCDGCQDLMKYLYEKRSELNLQIVLLPSVGPSAKFVRRLWCSRIKNKITDYDIIKWLVGRDDIALNEKLLTYDYSVKNCDVTPIVASTVTAQIYNLQGVPSTVREDGFVTNGFPKDFKSWIKQDISPIYSNPFSELENLKN